MPVDATAVQPQRRVAEPLDKGQRMRDQENRLPAAAKLRELVQALVGEAFVADRQHFVDEQHVGIDVNRHGEPEPHVHARRVGLHRGVDELAQLGKIDNLVEALLNLPLRQAEHDAVDEDVLAAGDLRVKSGAELDQRGNPPVDPYRPAGRLGDAGDELQRRALARPVPADDAEGRPRGTLNDTSDSAGNVSLGFRSRRMLRCSSALLSVANWRPP